MPRHARIDIPGLLQHVIVRGIEKCPIFLDDQDRANFLSRLRVLLSETETDCYAWALLDNHFHLLLQPKQRTLAEIMRRLLTGYAVVFNLRHHRAGHLFQNRYKSIVCDKDPYFLELVRYIHLNPVRAGIVGDLETLAAYPWCGHCELLGRASMPMIQVDEVLPIFARQRKAARQRYESFITDGLHEHSMSKLSNGGRRSSRALDPSIAEDAMFDDRILGGGHFVEQVLNTSSTVQNNHRMPLAELVQQVATCLQIAPATLSAPSKERNIVRAKAIISHIAVRKLGIKGMDVAATLGYSSTAVTQAAKRGETLLATERDLGKMLGDITKL
jgi:REP element-mobilizing transposase RayT